METMAGWMMIVILGCAVTFYTLGYMTGKNDGYKAGRSMGIRIGERRAIERRVSR